MMNWKIEKKIEKKIEEIIEDEEKQTIPTLKERAADVVSEFGGSWTFIILFMLFFVGWITFNVFIFYFDTYPFILLNLILSCIAVFQAPFILMSQNRMAQIDRQRVENDYKVNLHTELELQIIHDKIDKILDELSK